MVLVPLGVVTIIILIILLLLCVTCMFPCQRLCNPLENMRHDLNVKHTGREGGGKKKFPNNKEVSHIDLYQETPAKKNKKNAEMILRTLDILAL